MAELSGLRQLMRLLRDPVDGCPWDREQTYRSIVPHTLEEAYEVADAIENGDLAALPDELGDLLFQIVFYCQLAEEQGHFSFEDVVKAIETKLTERHPHVFGDETVDDAKAVSLVWEQRKAAERAARAATSELDQVPLKLPALSRAAKIQKRAARVGFDWPDVSGALAKIDEEMDELREAIAAGSDPQRLEDEFGDVLFSAVNSGRHLGLDAEACLRRATAKFERRFRALEVSAAGRGSELSAMSDTELEQLWLAVKAREKKTGA